MVQRNCQEETTNSENPHRGGKEPQGAKIAVENFEVNRKGFNRQKQKMTLKPVPTCGRSKVTSFNRHHIEPRVQLYVPKGKKRSLFH